MTDPALMVLGNDAVTATFDLARGCDLVGLVDGRTGVDVMFRSPWAGRAAAAARGGSQLHHADSGAAWLEGYQGGMQLLCPNAGAPSTFGGVTIGFHGEAAVVRWSPTLVEANRARVETELFTSPLRIEREITIDGGRVLVEDTVHNLAPVPVDFHAQYHPAFGSPLLGPASIIECGARTFVPDPSSPFTPLEPGRRHAWPPEIPEAGRLLSQLPEAHAPWAMLGWLTDFEEPWAAIRNPELDLAVGLRWDGAQHPHAWLWQEFGLATSFPWFGRAYVTAIEPSNTVPSGPERDTPLRLEPGASTTLWLRLTLCPGTESISSVQPDGSVRRA